MLSNGLSFRVPGSGASFRALGEIASESMSDVSPPAASGTPSSDAAAPAPSVPVSGAQHSASPMARVQQLMEERKHILSQKKVCAKELKSAQRRLRKLKKTVRNFSKEDLQQLLVMQAEGDAVGQGPKPKANAKAARG